jgi:hypothetical protein
LHVILIPNWEASRAMRRELPWMLGMNVAAVVLAALAIPAWAEPADSVYRKLQKDAPEFVKIKVVSVKTSVKETAEAKIISVVVEAKVLKVERSKSDLEKGDSIRIKYTHHVDKEPVPGPSEVPIVKKGKVYPAFLKKKGKIYTPAAGGSTFQVVK